MDVPKNRFKAGLKAGQPQIGMWCSMPGGYVAEMLAGAGYDWVLLDTEHAPGDPLTVLPQLQAMAAWPTSAVVRPAISDLVLTKRFLDLGAQTLLLPQVQSADEARAAVNAMRYPPVGLRGLAGATRAGGYGRIANYATEAERELCLLVQVETREALEQLDEIAQVEGVDGVFIGPADLHASFGYPGRLDHPEVVETIEATIRRLVELGVPAGILTGDRAFARRCLDLGALFVAVGMDIVLLRQAVDGLAREFGR